MKKYIEYESMLTLVFQLIKTYDMRLVSNTEYLRELIDRLLEWGHAEIKEID